MGKKIQPPACPYCQAHTVLLTGLEVYPHRRDLAERWFYVCAPCDARVGCHPGTKRPLGVPANAELRRARQILHNVRIDPLWQGAVTSGGYMPEDAKAIAIIRRTARSRVYDWLAWKLGMSRDEAHGAQFDLPDCRRAWTALHGVDYPTIRAWAKARRAAQQARDAATALETRA